MQWLSKSAEDFVASLAGGAQLDVLVVGSGYGGAVAALRFAQRGRQVTVLERGKEYVPGEFPNDFSQVGAHLRAEVASDSGVTPMGYEDALFDLRVGYRAGALVGSGLGGTSLVNAGVGLRAEDAVFKQPAWPAALRQEPMARWYRQAESELGLQTPTDQTEAGRQILQSHKRRRLEDFGAAAKKSGLDAEFKSVPIAVELNDTPSPGPTERRPCNGCGDCVTGCNFGAKLTLTETYLPRACQHKARMFTGISVLQVRHDPQGSTAFPWEVTFVRTGERRLAHDTRKQDGAADGYESKLRAKCVILAAGSFGSTEILLRSRARGLGLSSTALGMAVSGNADDLSFAFRTEQPVQGVGWGSQWPQRDKFIGPTITAGVFIREGDDLHKQTLVQDGGVPGLAGSVFHELVTTLGTVAQLGSKMPEMPGGKDRMALDPAARDHSMAVLAMGHDSAGGAMAYDTGTDRIGWAWPQAQDEPIPALHAERLAAVEALGAVFVQNPATGVLPPALAGLLNGPKPGGALFTVHPLGGCRMGDNALTGVVDDRGAVLRGDGKGVYEGLYVMDGSVVPTALGVNPLLTITALAERACHLILEQETGSVAPGTLQARPQATPAQHALPPLGTVLAEVLRGKAYDANDAQAAPLDAALTLRMPVPDWGRLMADPQHLIEAEPWDAALDFRASRLLLSGPGGDDVYKVARGTVNLFRADAPPSFLRRLLRSGLLFMTYAVNRWIPDLMKGEAPGGWVTARVIWKFLGSRCAALASKPWPPRPDRTGLVRLAMHRIRWQAAKALQPRLWPGAKASSSFELSSVRHLLWQATETRRFTYRLELERVQDAKAFTLKAEKIVDALPTRAAWGAWLRGFRGGGWPAIERRSVWQQLTEADFTLEDADGRRLRHGRLRMDLPELQRNLAPQMAAGGDSLNAMIALASYPLFLLRVLLATRLLDFRAPDLKPDLPDTDPAVLPGTPSSRFELEDPQACAPVLHWSGGTCAPEKPVPLEVRLRSGSEEKITIGLVRYKPIGGQPQKCASATWQGRTRVKSILLINGFAQNTRAFVAPELGPRALASVLYEDGWDVWLLEYRVSPLLRASARFSTMDDIAEFDIPAAVRHVRAVVEAECGIDERKSQVFAFSHCVGSASLAMSILGGWLADWEKIPGDPSRRERAAPHLAGVLFSQFQPFVVGSETAQQRLEFGAFLHNVLQRDMLNFAAGTAAPDLLHAMMDRVFASLHYGPDEQGTYGDQHCPHEHDLWRHQPDSTSCKRMSGILSRLFNHSQLHERTHANLDWYFGRTNLGVFLHGARCVQYERLVNANGQNVYARDDKIKRYFSMPIMLLHGEKNVLFDRESLWRSADQLGRSMRRDERGPGPSWIECLEVEDHAHFDCTIGKNAPDAVFDGVAGFFGNAWSQPDNASMPRRERCMARPPLTGPLVGWTREGGDPGSRVLRVWFEVDLNNGAWATAGLTQVRYKAGGRDVCESRAWPLIFSPWLGDDRASKRYLRGALVAYCVADIDVPAGVEGPVEIEAYCVYTFDGLAPVGNIGKVELPPGWGTPLGPKEVREDIAARDRDHENHLVLMVGDRPNASMSVQMHPNVPNGGNVPFTHHFNLAPGFSIPHVSAETELSSLDSLAGQLATRVSATSPASASASASATETQYAGLNPRDRPRLHQFGQTAQRYVGTALSARAFRRLKLSAVAFSRATRGVGTSAGPGTLSRVRRAVHALHESTVCWQSTGSLPGLSFLAAACRHPGLTAAEQERADLSLLDAAQRADPRSDRCMLMLGDQIYADARAGLFDSSSPIERMLPRYRQAFGSPGFRKLAAKLPLHMILDDHEIGDNWSQELRGMEGGEDLFETARDAYQAFQRSHGPHRPANGTGDAYFEHGGIHFLMLDTRSFRRRLGGRRTLSPGQWADLAAALRHAQRVGPDRPKFIISGSVLAPALGKDAGDHPARTADSWQFFQEDRRDLLRFIAQEGITRVVFLSSDYHCSAAARIEFSNGATAHAVCAPPLHAPNVFANATPDEVLALECVPLSGQLSARITCDFKPAGEGWMRVQLSQAGPTCKLALEFHLRDMFGPTSDHYAVEQVEFML